MKGSLERTGKFYVYIVECRDGTYYTGYTVDLERRIEEHNTGVPGAKYTRGRGPVRLVLSKEYRELSGAMKEECRIKKLSRHQKEQLMQPSSLRGGRRPTRQSL